MVTSETSLPVVELYDSNEGLIFDIASVAPTTPQQQNPTLLRGGEGERSQQTQPEQSSAQSDEPIELVVTGEQDSYRIPNASTGTRTDTPLRDIPQSIQVVPQQVIKDQGIIRVEDVLQNAAGVTSEGDSRSQTRTFNIRGFAARGLRNGFAQVGGFGAPPDLANNIEQVEVLRGPDALWSASGKPGGTINYITKQPLNYPYFAASLTAGQFGFYQPSIDLSGPLTTDKRLLYRLNVAYQNYGGFADFVNGQTISIAPVISYKFSDATSLKFEYEYNYNERNEYSGLPLDPHR
ncbi:TonB-dependent siderophore receptor [Nostoc sp.]|uniref:TonB-dependent siderophore receptor n=1 Tax=Nostoc sp. TaxID=1180 RepID=UPI002FFB29B4